MFIFVALFISNCIFRQETRFPEICKRILLVVIYSSILVSLVERSTLHPVCQALKCFGSFKNYQYYRQVPLVFDLVLKRVKSKKVYSFLPPSSNKCLKNCPYKVHGLFLGHLMKKLKWVIVISEYLQWIVHDCRK